VAHGARTAAGIVAPRGEPYDLRTASERVRAPSRTGSSPETSPPEEAPVIRETRGASAGLRGVSRGRPAAVLIAIAIAFAFGTGAVAPAAEPVPEGWLAARSPVTGLVSFLAGPAGGAIPVAPAPGEPLALLREHGALFGIDDPDSQLVPAGLEICSLGDRHHRFRQSHRGIPVLTGEIIVHQRADGTFAAANGDFYPIPAATPIEPSLAAEDAEFLAARALGAATARGADARLVIVDPRWYGDPPAGIRLAWRLRLEGPDLPPEWVLVDAIGGELLDHWPASHSALAREIRDGTSGVPGSLIRTEGSPPSGDADADSVYDRAGDLHRFLLDGLGRDGLDGAGSVYHATVHWSGAVCPNASWNGSRALFCDGLAEDDIIAHEFAHGLTALTADLIYQNQPGQLNESFSDVFGELVDLWNGDAIAAGSSGSVPPWPPSATGSGLDSPNTTRSGCGDGSVRWLMGEETSLGAIRDLWQPDCANDPPSTTHPFYEALTCDPTSDHGGVHRGSGVPNHAFAMLVDGKSYGGVTVNGIGAIKAGAVWYRALTAYLTPATSFIDAEPLFVQAANDLIGSVPFDPRTGLPSGSAISAADAAQVPLALQAVGFSEPGLCGAGPPPANDDCAGSLAVGPGAHPFDSTNATDGGAPDPSALCPGSALGAVAKDVWFSFTPPVDGLATFSTCGITPFDTDLVLYTGACGSLVPLACAGDTAGCGGDTSEIANIPVLAGETISIRVGAWGALVGWPGELSIVYLPGSEVCDNGLDDDGDSLADCDDPECTSQPVCIPWPGDECSSALPALLGATTFDTTGASASPDPVDAAECAWSSLGALAKDVWFSFVPPASGILTASVCGAAAFDTDLAVYSGSCGTLQQLACNGDGSGCAGGASLIDVVVPGGVPLWIRLGGRSAAEAGTGTLSLSLFVPPEVCANAADDDLDGWIDCEDDDCTGAPECVCEPIGPLACTQGFALAVSLAWTNGETYDSIVVRRDSLDLAILPGDATQFVDPSAPPGDRLYRVTGVCAASIAEASCAIAVAPPVAFSLIAPDLSVDFPADTGEASFVVELAIAELPGSASGASPTQGFSFGIAHDPALLVRDASGPTGLVAALGGGTGPDFYGESHPPGGLTVVAIYDFAGAETIPFAGATPVVAVEYRTVPAALLGATAPVATTLIWSEGIGTPPVENAVIVGGLAIGAIEEDGTITLVPVSSGFERGDCNADGGMNVADPVALLAYLFSAGPASCLDACDGNDDGIANIADAVHALAALFTQGPLPPSPFGSCGEDPTPDSLECDSYASCD